MKALLALALLGAAQPPQQFDLVCTPPATANPPFQSISIHLRLDLAAKHWCQGDCKVIHDIAEIQPATIWLEKETEAEQIQHLMHWSAVDRETGDYNAVDEFYILNEKSSSAYRSHCEKAGFSGFPKIETKF